MRFMLHVSHTMREKGPNMLQVITEDSQPSDAVTLMTDIAAIMASMEVTMMKMMMNLWNLWVRKGMTKIFI